MHSLTQTEDHPGILAETRPSSISLVVAEPLGDTQPVLSHSATKILNANTVLGKEIITYVHTPGSHLHRFFLMLLGLVGVLLPLFVGIWQFQNLEDRHGYYAALQRSWFWIILSLGIFVTYSLYVTVRSRNSKDFVAIHKNGIRFRLQNNRVCWLLYQNIIGIQEDLIQEYFFLIPLGKKYWINIKPKSGKPIRIPSSIDNLPELYTELKRQINPFLMQIVENAFSLGQFVEFGEIFLSPNELRYRSDIIQLKQIQSVAIHSGKLRILAESPAPAPKLNHNQTSKKHLIEMDIPLSSVNNLDVLLHFMSTRTQP